MQMVIEFLRRLKEGHVGFVTSKYVEIIEKPDAHVRTTSILNENSIQAISLRTFARKFLTLIFF